MLVSERSTFGTRLRALRQAKGLRQVELARKIGRHPTVIGPYERDEYMPPREIVERLAEALDSSPEYLLFGRSGQRFQVPVGGAVTAGGMLRERPSARAMLSLRSDSLMAFLVEDELMVPAYRPGQLVLVPARGTLHPRELVGEDALCELADGRVLLRRLQPAARPELFDLYCYAGAVLSGVRLAGARPVLGRLSRAAFLDSEG